MHERSAISKECEIMAGKYERSRMKEDLDTASMKRDEDDGHAIIDSVDAMVNPFEESNE